MTSTTTRRPEPMDYIAAARCGTCKSEIGARCVTPKGEVAKNVHSDRIRRAMKVLDISEEQPLMEIPETEPEVKPDTSHVSLVPPTSDEDAAINLREQTKYAGKRQRRIPGTEFVAVPMERDGKLWVTFDVIALDGTRDLGTIYFQPRRKGLAPHYTTDREPSEDSTRYATHAAFVAAMTPEEVSA